MTPEEQLALDHHIQEIAKILYADADKSRMTNLGEIEAVVREQVHKYVTPDLGIFLLQQLQAQPQAIEDESKASLEN